jgi:hypothetical protein
MHHANLLRRARPLALAASLAALGWQGAFAYSFSAWTSMTGAKTFAVTPFFYIPVPGASGTSLDACVGYGITDRVDLFANPANLSLNPFGYNGSWIMPRFAFDDNNVAALQMGYDGTDHWGGPHYHFFWENDKLALEANALAIFNAGSFDAGYAFGCLAPVWKMIPGILHPYLEIDPTVRFDKTYDVALAPGLWFGLPNTTHQISVSVPLSGLVDKIKGTAGAEIGVSIYAWYWYSFSLGAAE